MLRRSGAGTNSPGPLFSISLLEDLPVRRLTRDAGGSGRVTLGDDGLGNEVIGDELEILRRLK